LTISGTLSSGDDTAVSRWHIQECYWGEFSRTLALPGAAKGDDQSACLFGNENGCDQGQTPIFRIVTNVLLFIIGAVSVIMLIIGGFRYVTSQGDQTQVQSAKNTILYSIVGIVVAILAYAAVNFVISSFVKSE
jgi:hypothetical protein